MNWRDGVLREVGKIKELMKYDNHELFYQKAATSNFKNNTKRSNDFSGSSADH